MGFYQWLLQLPKWLQYVLALVLLSSSSYLHYHGTVWPWGWIFGLILLWVACFGRAPEDSDLD